MSETISRRTLLRATAGTVVAVAAGTTTGAPAAGAGPRPSALRELEEKIRDGMARYRIPGVAVGLLHHGGEYVRGFGVTNIDAPVPVDGDTVFRVASTTKTFTGSGRFTRGPAKNPALQRYCRAEIRSPWTRRRCANGRSHRARSPASPPARRARAVPTDTPIDGR